MSQCHNVNETQPKDKNIDKIALKFLLLLPCLVNHHKKMYQNIVEISKKEVHRTRILTFYFQKWQFLSSMPIINIQRLYKPNNIIPNSYHKIQLLLFICSGHSLLTQRFN